MTKTINLLAAFVVTLMPGAYGQGVRQMSIGEIFGLADRQNADIATADSRIATARQGEAVAQNARLPQLNASLTMSYLGDGTILDRDFGNATRDRLPHFSNTLGVELYQPVYTGGAISSGIGLAKKGTEMGSSRDFRILGRHSLLNRYYFDSRNFSNELVTKVCLKRSFLGLISVLNRKD